VMMKKWEFYMKSKYEKVRSRVWKGIPDCVRGEIWRLLSGAKAQQEEFKEKYKELQAVKSKWVTQIDLDVDRSSRNHIHFHERYGKGQAALFTTLKAYSVYDEQVGYCQGMSDMTSMMLKYTTEEDTFWILERLMQSPKYGMRNLVLPGFPLLQTSFQMHEVLLAQFAPALAEHFKQQNIMAAFYVTKWYMTAFLDIFTFDVTLRLWDILFIEGYDIVYSIALGCLRMFEGNLITKTFDQIMAIFRSFETMYIDPDQFVSFIYKHRIPPKKLQEVRVLVQAQANATPKTKSHRRSGAEGHRRSGNVDAAKKQALRRTETR